MGLREDKKQEQRSQIFDTAIGLFRERGFEATRVKDIITPLRISEATFFNYFPTKAAVIEEYGRNLATAFDAFVEDKIHAESSTVHERLNEISGLLAEAFVADRDFLQLLITETPLFFGIDSAQRPIDRQMMGHLTEIFRQGQSGGEIRTDVDPAQLAELYTAAFLLTITNWIIGWWEGQSLESRLAVATSVFLDGASIEKA